MVSPPAPSVPEAASALTPEPPTATLDVALPAGVPNSSAGSERVKRVAVRAPALPAQSAFLGEASEGAAEAPSDLEGSHGQSRRRRRSRCAEPSCHPPRARSRARSRRGRRSRPRHLAQPRRGEALDDGGGGLAPRLGSGRRGRARRRRWLGSARRRARGRAPGRGRVGRAGGGANPRAGRAAGQGDVLAGRDLPGGRAHRAPRPRQGRHAPRQARARDRRDGRRGGLRGAARAARRRPRDGDRAARRPDGGALPARRPRGRWWARRFPPRRSTTW